MSADARIWQAGENGWLWAGRHDGPCRLGAPDHSQPMALGRVITEIEWCLGVNYRWEIEEHGTRGMVLSGWHY